MDTPIIVQHLGNVGEINAIEAGVLHAEGRTAGVQLLSNVGQINIVGAGYTIRGSDTARVLKPCFWRVQLGNGRLHLKTK